MEFRSLNIAKDLDFYLAGDIATFSDSFPNTPLPEKAIQDITQGIKKVATNQQTHGITACDRGEPIGFIILSLQSFLNNPFVNIESIYVSPTYRGKGVAQRLLRLAEDWGLSHHAKTIKLEVSNTNQHAIQRYHKSGYISTRTQMEKAL